ncbi:hypothetical protein QZH41_013538, partial [Actinostola sp. cb2023]
YSGNPQEVDLVFRDANYQLSGPLIKSSLQSLTVCFWFNTSSEDKYHTHIHYINTKDKNYVLHVATSSLQNTNQFHVYINSKQRTIIASRPLHDGVWHHVCTTWNGTIGALTVYLDGEHQGTKKDQEIVDTIHFDGDVVYIGQEFNLTIAVDGHNFFGEMSHMNMWSFVLSANDISRMSKSCNENTEGNILPWRNFVNGQLTPNKVLMKRNSTCPLARGRDCVDLLHKGYKINGFYLINPDNKGYFSVMCDQQTNGGGWTVIQRRLDRSVDFYQDWNTYKLGFGNPHGEFWLGNNLIHRVGSTYSHLLMEVKDSTTDTFELDKVHIRPESKQFGLYISSNVGKTHSYSYNSFCYVTNALYMFSTKDKDHNNIASNYRSGFWIYPYRRCDLNTMQYGNTHRVLFRQWKENPKTEIKLRPLRGKPLHCLSPIDSMQYVLLLNNRRVNYNNKDE